MYKKFITIHNGGTHFHVIPINVIQDSHEFEYIKNKFLIIRFEKDYDYKPCLEIFKKFGYDILKLPKNLDNYHNFDKLSLLIDMENYSIDFYQSDETLFSFLLTIDKEFYMCYPKAFINYNNKIEPIQLENNKLFNLDMYGNINDFHNILGIPNEYYNGK